MYRQKYRDGKQILSMSEFAQSKSDVFVLYLGGPRTRHKKVLKQMEYGVLDWHIKQGHLFEAQEIKEETKCT